MTAPNITTIDESTTVTTTVVVPPPVEDETQETKMEETPEEREQRIMMLKQLARQLEYYFSEANLSKDTYLSTLRDLNDSYVPISIIANFGKVQALVPYESALEAVVFAATDHSDLLEIVELDETGKKISNTEEEKKDESEIAVVILAVGSISGKPIPTSQIQPTEKAKTSSGAGTPSRSSSSQTSDHESSSSTVTNPVQNTIILRDVAEDVEEKTLRDLFAFEGCPSIESIHADLHNCWFVTLATTSKNDMFDVMMKLRTAEYPSGDSVKARLKSSALVASTSTPNSVVFDPNLSYSPHFRNNGSHSNTGGNSRKKRSSNNKGRSSSSNSSGASSSNKPKSNQQSITGATKRRNGKDEPSPSGRPYQGNAAIKGAKKKVMTKPPSMGESNFPSLPFSTVGNSKSCQVEKVPADDEMMQKGRNSANSGCSDSSSTATTSTASTPTETPPTTVVTGGYVAALLKPAVPAPVNPRNTVEKSSSQQLSSASEKGEEGSKREDSRKVKEGKLPSKKSSDSESVLAEVPAVSVQPPSWGKGRSFADIVSA
mmetsp:Transcript_4943/g.14328  ORF Transcript_4943/g.14328 Transcript_4943/m.14328 type:complete len:545 (-) Transcript_4943:710-2344(-)